MNTENRDFVIERLERQLKEKESEIDDIKTNLRESILREIRSDLKTDLDFHNRIVELERKVQAMNNNINGVMDELLDQKSMIRSLKETPVPKPVVEKKTSVEIPEKDAPQATATPVPKSAPTPAPAPKLYRPEPKPVETSPLPPKEEQVPSPSAVPSAPVSARPAPKVSAPSAGPMNSKVTIRSDEDAPAARTPVPSSSNVRFNVREIPSVKPPEMPEPEHRSEYIIAETDDERQLRLSGDSRRDTKNCNYIVAEEDTPASCNDEDSEYETVESREDEDAVVVTTRRR
ncbi:hypothetical protein [Methanolobus sp. WCC4]|uniref:hypothetical protein n=1 Tax=Methanolobus sp. WCC4 TaxID=3125784 RepID=UPI0030F83197